MTKRITSLTLAVALVSSTCGVSAAPYATAGAPKAPASSAGITGQLPTAQSKQATAADAQLIKLAKKPKIRRGPPAPRPGPGPRPKPRPKHKHHHRGHYKGVEIGIGIAILGLLAAEAAKSSGYNKAMRRCARKYRSFDWESGTYVTYGGKVRLCPYLRPYVR
jgi:hypothetical protein